MIDRLYTRLCYNV